MNDTTQPGPGALVQAFVEVFRAKDAALLADFVHPDVEIHHLGLPGGPVAPIMNLAVYEVKDGLIAAWRDYTNAEYARGLLADN
jgi:limonene-1,2-epoxide hydrolase